MAETSKEEATGAETGGDSGGAAGRGASLPGVRGGGLPGMRDGASQAGVGVGPPASPTGSGSISAVRSSLPPPPRRETSLSGSSSGIQKHALPPRPGEILDEEAERWLIQKEDKMDYGPFSLREVKAQIEKGTVAAEHTILDNETGDKRRVADHPLLGAMAREWTAKHAELDRQMKDQAERAKYQRAVINSLSGIFAVLVVLGVGVGAYFKFFYKPKVVEKVVKNDNPDDFFKGVNIAMKVDPPAPKKTHTKRKGPKNGAFDDTQNMDFADEGDTLSADDIQRVMNSKFGLLGGCLRAEAQKNPGVKKLDLEFLVKGNGSVSSVKVNGQTGSEVASCVFAKMQAIQFPECKTCQKTHAAFSLSLK